MLIFVENFKMARQITKHRRFISEPQKGEITKGGKAPPPSFNCAMKSFT